MSAPAPGDATPAEPLANSGGVVSAILAAARPAQWVKNLVLPLPFLFGGALGEPAGWALAAAGFAIFCVITSGVYIVNDVADRERDRAHPVKKFRPLASGRLSASTAVSVAAVLETAGLAAAFLLKREFGFWCAVYAVLMLTYSLLWKRVPFLEALVVAAGMPLRALAGAALAGVDPSLFLMGCAYLLALFLVAGKRQWEFLNAAPGHRPALAAYREEGLDHLFIVTGLATVAAYAAYSTSARTLDPLRPVARADRAFRGARDRPLRPAGLQARRRGESDPGAADRRSVASPDRDRLGGDGGLDHLWPLIRRPASRASRRPRDRRRRETSASAWAFWPTTSRT